MFLNSNIPWSLSSELGELFLQSEQLTPIIQNQPYVQKKFKHKIRKKHRLVLLGILAITFCTYRIFHTSWLQEGQYIRDFTHMLTQKLNEKINQGGDFYYYFMIVGQLLVDIQMSFFIIFQMFKVENFLLCLWIGLFYGVRALFLNILKFPYPEGIYWTEPGFPPSIGVPYGITRDFFYSGHTGLLLFSYFFWALKKETLVLKYISWFGTPYIVLLVLATRVHYVVDCVGAVIFTLWIYEFCQQKLIFFDRFFSKWYGWAGNCADYFQLWLMFVLKLKKSRKVAPSK